LRIPLRNTQYSLDLYRNPGHHEHHLVSFSGQALIGAAQRVAIGAAHGVGGTRPSPTSFEITIQLAVPTIGRRSTRQLGQRCRLTFQGAGRFGKANTALLTNNVRQSTRTMALDSACNRFTCVTWRFKCAPGGRTATAMRLDARLHFVVERLRRGDEQYIIAAARAPVSVRALLPLPRPTESGQVLSIVIVHVAAIGMAAYKF
jgi:hypothetical protein